MFAQKAMPYFILTFVKCTIIKLLPTLRLSRHNTNFCSSHFASILTCLACLGGIVLGKNTVLHIENETK